MKQYYLTELEDIQRVNDLYNIPKFCRKCGKPIEGSRQGRDFDTETGIPKTYEYFFACSIKGYHMPDEFSRWWPGTHYARRILIN